MPGECIIKLTPQDLNVLAAVFDCQVDALPVVVYEACVSAVHRAVAGDEWEEDRLPTYDEFPVVDLAAPRLIFIPNTPALDVMDWLAGAAADFSEGRLPGGIKCARRAEKLAQAMARHLGYEVEPPEAAPERAAVSA